MASPTKRTGNTSTRTGRGRAPASRGGSAMPTLGTPTRPIPADRPSPGKQTSDVFDPNVNPYGMRAEATRAQNRMPTGSSERPKGPNYEEFNKRGGSKTKHLIPASTRKGR